MHFKLITCKVLQREIASVACRCPNTLDITTIRQSYHDTPVLLNQILQQEIDRIDSNTDAHTNDLQRRDIDAILLGYGLCSNAVCGLRSKKYPLIIPRAHDCITLVMGSKEVYRQYFNSHKGSFFYTRGWYELSSVSFDAQTRLGRLRRIYLEKYEDEDTVEYLLDMERDMLKHYNSITYIDWPQLSDPDSLHRARDMANKRNWEFHPMTGSSCLLEDLVNGNWDTDRFLVLAPGETAESSSDGNIIRKCVSSILSE